MKNLYISLQPVSILYTLCFLCFRADTRFVLTMFFAFLFFSFFSVLLIFLSQIFFLLFHFNMFMSLFCHRIEMFMHRAKECLSFFFFFFFLFSLYNLFSTGQFNLVTAAKQTGKNKQNLTYVHKKGIKYENYHFISWMCFHFNFSFRCVECAFYRAVCTVSFRSSYEWWKNVTLVSYSNDMKWNVTRIKKNNNIQKQQQQQQRQRWRRQPH